MMICFVVFTEPGHVFESIHWTVDGATAMAVSCGAAAMPDGAEITIDAVTIALGSAPAISLKCHAEDGIDAAHIERHAILV